MDWPTLQSRIIHFHKVVNHYSGLQIPQYIQLSTRVPTKFIQPHCQIELYKHSFFPRTVNEWNLLDKRELPIAELSKQSFIRSKTKLELGCTSSGYP